MVLKISDIRAQVSKYSNPKFPTLPKRAHKEVSYIVIHSTICDGYPSKMSLNDMMPYCVSKNHFSKSGAPCFSYHMVVEDRKGELKAFRCLDYNIRSWHVGSWNRWSVGIASIGPDSVKRKDALAFLATVACLELGLIPDQEVVIFHRDAPGCYKRTGEERVYFNNCPGSEFERESFAKSVVDMYGELMESLQDVVNAKMGEVSAIKDFQKKNDLPITGKLDYNIIKMCYGL